MKLQLWFHTLIYQLADAGREEALFILPALLSLPLHSWALHKQTFLFAKPEKVLFFCFASLVI